ncbi:MAG: HD domain-containing protein [Bdellovibrionales bacterium]|nr:HD domain-containing protein [Bdellovibrionales bacterium]
MERRPIDLVFGKGTNYLMENLKDRLNQQFKFLIEIDKLKNVERQNILSDSSRRENSAEHSWHLALLALVLKEHACESVDVLKVIKMLLIHDLVEIDVGDTFLHEPEAQRAQSIKEKIAAERIFSILPEDQTKELLNCWEEFESGSSPEARFAKALDRIQPALLHEATDAVIWQKYETTVCQITARMKEVRENTPKLWPRVKEVIDRAIVAGRLKT